MRNYDRYINKTSEEYEKENVKTIMYYLFRIPSDRIIVPSICKMKGKRILDVGLGAGSYTKLLIDNNQVTGVDQNPHLCKLPIKVHTGDATELSKLVGDEKFDVVLSTWMTDYFDGEKLQQFFNEARKVLKDGGSLMTTTIRPNGWGLVYLFLARYWRRADKHGCAKKRVIEKLKKAGFNDIQLINLNSWLGIPWACLVIAK